VRRAAAAAADFSRGVIGAALRYVNP
jgi:hypothetical protein